MWRLDLAPSVSVYPLPLLLPCTVVKTIRLSMTNSGICNQALLHQLRQDGIASRSPLPIVQIFQVDAIEFGFFEINCPSKSIGDNPGCNFSGFLSTWVPKNKYFLLEMTDYVPG
uniref:Uncharacterized protein n=1 Tax=Physcomitrium patens TaxID=3218 RepID=A0A2K1KSY5_PHYPA|nr:hypothetical protein PHYPA_003887 [Physcomitrium patens]